MKFIIIDVLILQKYTEREITVTYQDPPAIIKSILVK